jgi:hypothetical protein
MLTWSRAVVGRSSGVRSGEATYGRRIAVLFGLAALWVAACGGKGAASGQLGTGGSAGGSAGGSTASGGGNGGTGHPAGGGAGTTAASDASVDGIGEVGPSDAGVGGGSAAGSGGAAAGGMSGSAGVGGTVGGGGGSSAGGAGGSGGDSNAPLPSPGCALANSAPPRYSPGDIAERRFPGTYDGVTPVPLIMAFHATNYSARNLLRDLADGQPAAQRFVILAPDARLLLTAASMANFESVDTARLSSLLVDTLAELCIDERRIFGVGSGSGGRFLIRLVDLVGRSGTPRGLRFRAAGVVGTYFSGGRQGAYPTIFIHAANSQNSASIAQDADGTKAVQIFRTRNVCGESSTPASASVAGCMAGAAPVSTGCVDFADCSAPLRWCQYGDPAQAVSADHWPCFAGGAILDFFER